uniref:PIN-like protein n=1 Tax=Peronospora matthiolae TaxID=2874970 RepID=A0AAV1T7C8_9STRA
MVNGDLVLAVRFWILCSTLLMIYMPSLFVRKIYREKAVGSASLTPIFLVLANSHVWIVTGHPEACTGDKEDGKKKRVLG